MKRNKTYMMNYSCGMVDQRKAFSLIFSRDYCQRSSPSWISETPRAGFEPVQNLSSGFVEWSRSVVITTTRWCRWVLCSGSKRKAILGKKIWNNTLKQIWRTYNNLKPLWIIRSKLETVLGWCPVGPVLPHGEKMPL